MKPILAYFSTFTTRFPQQMLRLSWGFWFIVANVVMSWLFAIQLLCFLFPLDLPQAWLAGEIIVGAFAILTYLAYLALLTSLYFGICLIPLLWFVSNRRLLNILATVVASLYLYWLLSDSLVFVMFRFHLNTTLLRMLFNAEAYEMFHPSTLEISSICVLALLILVGERLLLKLSQSWSKRDHHPKLGKKLVTTAAIAVGFSYYIYFLSLAAHTNAFSQQTKVLPLYQQLLAALSPNPNALTTIERYRESKYMQLKQAHDQLHYPLQALSCKPAKHPFNIMFIVIDTWRLDALNQLITPNIHRYLSRGVYFNHHYSGGNSTQAGIFSLFYSLPINYWTAMLDQQLAPEFLNELQRQHYRLGIFASAELTLPAFDKTVFAKVSPLKLEADGATPAARDRNITQQAIAFLQNRSSPFFAYLFYDSAHAYCTEQDFAQPFQPAISHCMRIMKHDQAQQALYRNRYDNALHFVDEQVGAVLQQLNDRQLLENTVVIITGDHGQEFNDNHRGYWEHGSNYTPYQIQTPLLILWPKHEVETISTLTSHYDIIPTLMHRVLACQSPSEHYSVGQDLFTHHPASLTIVGSYINFAFISDRRIMVFYPSGHIEVQDLTAKPLNEQPDPTLIAQGLQLLRRFYR